jgi:hypothetical protein
LQIKFNCFSFFYTEIYLLKNTMQENLRINHKHKLEHYWFKKCKFALKS